MVKFMNIKRTGSKTRVGETGKNETIKFHTLLLSNKLRVYTYCKLKI